MRIKGKITSWKGDKGFGFITPNGGGQQVFVHIKAFNRMGKTPAINQLVTYSRSSDKQGRPCAEDVTRAGELLSKNTKKKNSSFTFIIPILFVVFVGISAFTNNIELVVLPFYIVINLLTFVLYAVDKSTAQNGSWRIKESTLHLFSLIGGWSGAMIAQQTLRHKSKKQNFRAVFWVTVILNIGAFIWLHTSEGGAIKTFQSSLFSHIDWLG
ncbi:MAG: cold shock and DUF1294 domain-containing protein [Candidatus Endonucleobacter bathymodioli]|uniref:Cold shock and DUF1294 domain-containing protein n=1 Tax=Candidatus Endonucleibacter bathymodioli TaxID=539814 RepID=A0AA90NKU4_9GAMM|nr:cold shock and DUF1294 domain-containing protein [Candidatus Endonucleobacter bathymodioli]